ncbi:MAG: PD-(D/E)XK nuclease family protein [Flavobacteriales bacterium]|nr:PD-(D/E)XK nuclease family protein [Flavobacteriales bacterium]
MEPFLRQLATLLVQDHGKDLADVAVVLPSQRAGLYLRRHLAEVAGTTIWSPQVITLSGLVESISGLRTAATTDLLFDGHAVLRTLAGQQDVPFSEYLQWAPTALRDMSEVDAHLINLDSFYRDLRNWEELDWSFNDVPLSQGQERMLRYWAMKGDLHRALNERLLTLGRGTAGAVERAAVEVADRTKERTRWTKVWAAGLNALTPALQAVLRTLKQYDLLEVAWDTDRYYLEDPLQEAGEALRHNIGAFGPGRIPPSDHLRQGQRTIEVINLPNAIAQVHWAASELNGLNEGERSRAAVVLADEQLLMPLLNTLPQGIGPVNVTMGIRLNALPVGGLLDAVVALHCGHRSHMGYRLADVARVLGHPFLFPGTHQLFVRNALLSLGKERRTHVSGTHVLQNLTEAGAIPSEHALELFRSAATDGPSLGRILLHALSWAREATLEDELAQEQLFLASRAQNRIDTLLQHHGLATDIATYREIHQRILREERIGLFGEPLAGVQIMGMLETRALDIERILLLSAEEGTLPPSSSDRSFIPFELRRGHGLPLRHKQDAVSAYHFLRAIQRGNKLQMACSTNEGSMGHSRFALQLEHELAPTSNTTLLHRSVQAPVPARRAVNVQVERDDLVLGLIRQRLERGISPSALSTWLKCPLDHYFKYVLRLEDTDEVQDQLPADQLGSAIHKALENGYRPLVGKPLDPIAIDELAVTVPKLLRDELNLIAGAEALTMGQPLLQSTMAEQAIAAFLQSEQQRVSLGTVVELIGLEEILNVPLPDALAAHGCPVNIGGRVDRIERRDGEVVILDLKTGTVREDQVRLSTLDAELLRPDKDHYALQLLVYAWAYLIQHPEVTQVKAGLVPLQRSSESSGLFLKVLNSEVIHRDLMPSIESLLHRLVEQMLDPSTPIEHRAESRYCSFCLV